jgi:Dyp-type peroxidase family
MTTEDNIREAPAPTPFPADSEAAAEGEGPEIEEDRLRVENIQGNILGGFNKDFQTLLFYRIEKPKEFKKWLNAFVPFIATSAEVIAFNRLYKSVRSRRQKETNTVKATWINIAFSQPGLKKLRSDASFNDAAFMGGLLSRSEALGDPKTGAGSPSTWKIGGPNKEAEVVLIVASDDKEDMEDTVKDIKKNIQGAKKLFEDEGRNLPGDLHGHEHFGFLDGVSQPGIRGHVSDDPSDVLTPRQNPENRQQGKPGQELLWPGEFVFGYHGQIETGEDITPPGPEVNEKPSWSSDGSFLVFRRLRQDVSLFHKFLNKLGKDFKIDPDLVGAKLVGRWPSGSPVVRLPDTDPVGADGKRMGDDDCANNNFEFNEEEEEAPPAGPPSPADCVDHFPSAPTTDPEGKTCPFSAHIRKSYPRNDKTPAAPDSPDGSEVDTQNHRLLRRGIPFGEVSKSTPKNPKDDNVDRGLHFLAYQTSIEDQFEFVTEAWVNNPDFSTEAATGHENGCGELPVGHDPIIGQNNTPGQNRERKFFIRFGADGAQCRKILTKNDWVIPNGGGYFFAPSISALKDVLS